MSVVDQLTHVPMIKGLDPAVAGKGGEKLQKVCQLSMREKNK
jgi:hypothetical protein